jgi:integrase
MLPCGRGKTEGVPLEALNSHCYVKKLKRYALAAGIDGFHQHQTRHTFARTVICKTALAGVRRYR